MTQTIKNKYALVLIHTMLRHAYYYGDDIEGLVDVWEQGKKEIANDKLEWVELRTYPEESRMLDYIEKKKAFYLEGGYDINFIEMRKQGKETSKKVS